jgi:TolB-like protein
MSPDNDAPTVATDQPASPDAVNLAAALDKKRRKKKEKVRSAWISFVGRIVAQIMGAVATIVLGLMVVHKYQLPLGKAQSASNQTAAVAAPALPARAITPGQRSLAVLPMANFSADTDVSFADAMTEELITDLSRLTGIRVLSRTSSMAYKHGNRRLPEIARELGVDYVLEGSVTKAGNRVRITAQLIDARSDEHLWADSYERPLKDVLAVQSTVATAIAQSVSGALTRGTPRPRAIVSTGEPSGRALLNEP